MVDTNKQDLHLFWKNNKGETQKTFQNQKTYVESNGSTLLFGANAGMYNTNFSPLGLFIQE
jgi:uncharacterized protein YigE (DUF2233 family)